MFKELLSDFKSLDIDELRYPGFVKKMDDEDKISYENVKKGKGWHEPNEDCPLCGCAKRVKIFGIFDIDYLECDSCGCAYVEKFPVDPSDIYSGEEYEKIAEISYLNNVDYRKERFGFERLGLVNEFVIADKKKASLLDIGCGTGWFLDVAKNDGYNVCGIELGKQLAKATEERLKINIHTEALSTFKDSEMFDVITLFDVIEHVKDPIELMTSVYNHLLPGGVAIIFTPNLNSFAIQTLKENSSLVCPCDHIFLFSEKSIRKISEKLDFSVVYTATKGSDIIDMYAHYDQTLEQREAALFLRDNSNALQAMIDQSNSGNHLRMVLRK